jgi:hypothetical protein
MNGHPILAAAPLALALAISAPSGADLVEFDDPAALVFSGGEVQLEFETLATVGGAAITEVGDVAVALEAATGEELGGARFGNALEPREFGPQGPGNLNNFEGGGLPFPFPGIRVTFAEPVHRVAFAVRANEADEVRVAFRFDAAEPLETARQSPTQGTFHFYGYESTEGVREIVVSAGDSLTALALDNLTYEVVPEMEGGDPGAGDPGGDGDGMPGDPGPVADVPVFQCEGFLDPAADRPGWARHAHGRFADLAGKLLQQLPFRLLSATLVDHHGVIVTPQELWSPPVVQVLHTPPGGETQDITPRIVRRGSTDFVHRYPTDRWFKVLWRRDLAEPGTYVITLESGDPQEYAVDPTCVEWIVREPPPDEARSCHRWMRRWRGRFGR